MLDEAPRRSSARYPAGHAALGDHAAAVPRAVESRAGRARGAARGRPAARPHDRRGRGRRDLLLDVPAAARRASTSSTSARTSPACCAAPRTSTRPRTRPPASTHGEERLRRRPVHACTRRSAWASATSRRPCRSTSRNHDAVTPERMRELIVAAARRRACPTPRARPGDRQLQGAPRARWRASRRCRRRDDRLRARLTRNWDDPARRRARRATSPRGGYEGLRQALAMATADIDRAGEGLRPARPRRRRVPHGHEVVVRAARHRQAHLRRRQLRRVRAGHVQQPRARRARAAPPARGHGDRRARDRVPDRLHLRARRVPVAVDRARARDRRGVRRRVPRRRHLWLGQAGRRRVAPGRRRLHLRRGDRAAELAGGSARSASPAAPVPGGGRPVRQPDRHQQRRDAHERARHHHQRRRVVPRRRAPRSRPARSCSRSAARSNVPATTRSRWARRSPRCSRSWRAACSVGGR